MSASSRTRRLLEWSGLTLARPVGGSGPIGSPVGGGLVVAFLVTALLIFLALSYGLKWNTSVWWKAAAIFYALYILMYTSFLTNGFGIGSGVWQSLGYWVVQQGEGRGSQPWYYYTIITTLYEFLPLLLSIIGSVYYLRKRDKFGLFLVYWVWTTFLLYTIASEKMPWLLVNITLPMIVLSGKFLNDIIVRVEWKRVSIVGGVLTLVGVPLFLALLWNLAFLGLDGSETVADLPVDTLGMALAVGRHSPCSCRILSGSQNRSRRLCDDWHGLNCGDTAGTQWAGRPDGGLPARRHPRRDDRLYPDFTRHPQLG